MIQINNSNNNNNKACDRNCWICVRSLIWSTFLFLLAELMGSIHLGFHVCIWCSTQHKQLIVSADACIDQKTKSIAVVLLHTVRTVAHTLYHILCCMVWYCIVLYYIYCLGYTRFIATVTFTNVFIFCLELHTILVENKTYYNSIFRINYFF